MAKCDPDRVNRKMIHVNEHPQVCCCGVQTWETMLGEEPAVKVALLGGLRGFMATFVSTLTAALSLTGRGCQRVRPSPGPRDTCHGGCQCRTSAHIGGK